MPTYESDIRFLQEAIDSVRGQLYQKWELVIVDDASAGIENIQKQIESYNDPRILFHKNQSNKGIAETLNIAIDKSSGEYISFLDHDDRLHVLALYHLVKTLNKVGKKDILYSDEDILNEEGQRTQPNHKPAFTLENIRRSNCVNHYLVINRIIGDKVGWYRPEFSGAQDYDLILRIMDALDSVDHIYHIPEICYHWRKSPQSISYSPLNKSHVNDTAMRALNEHLDRNKLSLRAIPSKEFGYFDLVKKG